MGDDAAREHARVMDLRMRNAVETSQEGVPQRTYRERKEIQERVDATKEVIQTVYEITEENLSRFEDLHFEHPDGTFTTIKIAEGIAASFRNKGAYSTKRLPDKELVKGEEEEEEE